jgi:FtsP/CotA-like multicopper oxidase with cupredoxin domain
VQRHRAILLLAAAAVLWCGGIDQGRAQFLQSRDLQSVLQRRLARVTQADREAAAARAAAARTQGPALAAPLTAPAPGGTPNYFGPEPNWAWSPRIRKFVDRLPQLGQGGANGLGQYVPIAVADTITYPGSDYYEIEVREFTEKMHSDLKPTTLRGYVQTNVGTDGAGHNTVAPAPIHYMGPVIIAQKNRPVRIKFTNGLPTGAGGNLFLPVDTTEMGAGMGPLGMDTTPGFPMNYTQNRAVVHLHGGATPWISDGTPHQWITPAGESTDYPSGVSMRSVPDMPDPGPGSTTLYYTNQQSARLMFYHDHAYGITRLTVYAGGAAPYVVTDAVEQDLVARGIIPDYAIPLVIQDKTFIDPTTVLASDPTWPFPIDAAKSNLWYPHVYMTNQNPNDIAGINPLGRWDYGPWFWPPWPVENPPITLPDETVVPNVPNLSMTMEAFMDTPVINGTAYPYLNVKPKAYRFRILNAANDRFWNLQLWQADPTISSGPGIGKEVKMVPAIPGTWPAGWPTPDSRDGGWPDPTLAGPNIIQIGHEGGFLPAPVVWPNIPIGWDTDPKSITVGNIKEHNLFLGPAERADVIIDFSAYAGKTLILYNDAPAAVPARDVRLDYYTGNMDLRSTGGTSPTTAGFGPNTRTIMQIRVANMAPAPPFNLAALQAEFASTAARPGVFVRSADPIIVPQAGYNSAYNATFPADAAAYARIQDTSLTFTPLGATTPLTINFKPKSIAEEFESQYGRMSAFLGVEVPFTNGQNQTTIWYGYIDPPTEIINDTADPVMTPIGAAGDGTQIWKITHNGVDTHPIHFHLFNVQLINRVDWAGVVKPPEPNELGWKETVRMNPLEDCIVALRPVAPKVPFGVPDSVRPLDPAMPLGSTEEFKGVDPNGNPVTVTNELTNFGWEYVWHCHILSHEEMDMMRPMVFNVARALPAAPILTYSRVGVPVDLTWIDGTPASDPATWGNPANEIGFRIERATISPSGAVSAYALIGSALANATNYTDNTAAAGTTYNYRVTAYNAAGSATSAPAPFATGSVKGQVRAAGTTTDLVGATVAAYRSGALQAQTTTGTYGIYQIADLLPGTVTVVASASGYVRQSKNTTIVAGGISFVNCNLSVSGRLRGQVRDRVTGAALVGATVTVSSGGVIRATGTTTAPYGIYDINADLPTGTYIVAASNAGYLTQTKNNIAITAGATTFVNFNLSK